MLMNFSIKRVISLRQQQFFLDKLFFYSKKAIILKKFYQPDTKSIIFKFY